MVVEVSTKLPRLKMRARGEQVVALAERVVLYPSGRLAWAEPSSMVHGGSFCLGRRWVVAGSAPARVAHGGSFPSWLAVGGGGVSPSSSRALRFPSGPAVGGAGSAPARVAHRPFPSVWRWVVAGQPQLPESRIAVPFRSAGSVVAVGLAPARVAHCGSFR